MAIQYGLVAAMIAGMIILLLARVGTDECVQFSRVAAALQKGSIVTTDCGGSHGHR